MPNLPNPASIRVGLTVLGFDNQTRVPCGNAIYVRCEPIIDDDGMLSILSQDTGYEIEHYAAERWTEAVVYDKDGRLIFAASSPKWNGHE